MSFPKVLNNFNVFVGGRSYAGKADISTPELAIKMESHRAGGMDAGVDIDMGMETPELNIKFHEYDADVIKLFGQTGTAPVTVIARGALKGDDGVVTPVLIEMRGRAKKMAPGDWKGGEKAVQEFNVSCTYYRWNQNNEDLIEVDVENMIRKIGGVDQLAEVRGAIGI